MTLPTALVICTAILSFTYFVTKVAVKAMNDPEQ